MIGARRREQEGAHPVAVVAGASDDAIEGVEVVVRSALEARADDVLAADGYVLGTPANFGYMSGALKHFFDSTFLAVGGALSDDGSAGTGDDAGTTSGRPFGLLVHGRYDVTGAVRSVTSIVAALGWRQAAATVEVLGDSKGVLVVDGYSGYNRVTCPDGRERADRPDRHHRH